MTSLATAFADTSPFHPFFPAIDRPDGFRQAGRERFLRRLIGLEARVAANELGMPQSLAQAFVAGDADDLEASLGALGLEQAEPWLDLAWRRRTAICLATLACLVPRHLRGDLNAGRLGVVWPFLETSARDTAEVILADQLGLDWLATHLDPEATWEPRELLDEDAASDHDLSRHRSRHRSRHLSRDVGSDLGLDFELEHEIAAADTLDVLPLAA